MSQGEYVPGASTELSDYVRILRRRWKLIAIILGVVMALAVVGTLLSSPGFTASAKVQLPAPTGQISKDVNTTDVATELAVMKSQPVAENAARLLKTNMTIDKLLSHVSVVNPPDARVLVVSFNASNAHDAQAGAEDFAKAYIQTKTDDAKRLIIERVTSLQSTINTYNNQIKDANNRLLTEKDPQARANLTATVNRLTNALATAQGQQSDAEATPIDGGQILQDAKLPRKHTGILTNVSIAFILGLGLALVVAFVRERLDEQVHEPSDLEDVLDVPILGSIPQFPERFRNRSTALVTVHAPEGAQADSFRRLRAALLIAMRDREVKVLAITSPSAGDGKSTIAANLAVALAQSGRSVVLISADVRRPTLEQFFELPDSPGLLDVLAGDATMDEAIIPVGRISLMTSGRIHSNPTDLLQSKEMEEVITAARERFEIVIVDTPPVLAVADVLGMVPMIDAVVLVVSVDATAEADVSDAHRELEQSGAHVLGAVINRSNASTARYENYYRDAPDTRR